MSNEWRNVAGFYWSKTEHDKNDAPIFIEVSVDLANSWVAAAALYGKVCRIGLPPRLFGFKNSCFYNMDLDGRPIVISCFRTHSVTGEVISNRICIRPCIH